MRISSKLRSVVTALLLATPIAACNGFSSTESGVFNPATSDQCTFTQGFWQNHPEVFPVESLTLGDRAYTKAELLLILNTEVSGNGLIALSHQLIAAKLNVAYGAPDADIADEIAAADALIAGLVVPPIGDGYLATSVTTALNDALDAFNNSELSGDACVETPPPACGDGTVDAGEQCDDGNTTNGDGCSSTCQTEPPPPPPPACGDGTVDAGEQCDDGNTANGDGCSSTCQTEPPPPPPPACGDGTVDAGEQCDDGNTTNGDGCSATCQTEPPPPPPPCCGDGNVDAGEQCDDGNTSRGDGCSATCTLEPVCVK
jgi:cysteine-rich repeat protein